MEKLELPEEIWSIIGSMCLENRVRNIYLVSKSMYAVFRNYLESRMGYIEKLIISGSKFVKYVLNVCVYSFYSGEINIMFSGKYILVWTSKGTMSYDRDCTDDQYNLVVDKMKSWIRFLLPNIQQPERYSDSIIHSPKIIRLKFNKNYDGEMYTVNFQPKDHHIETGTIKYFPSVDCWSGIETIGGNEYFKDWVSGNIYWQLDNAKKITTFPSGCKLSTCG